MTGAQWRVQLLLGKEQRFLQTTHPPVFLNTPTYQNRSLPSHCHYKKHIEQLILIIVLFFILN
jgi:hypothetical protein